MIDLSNERRRKTLRGGEPLRGGKAKLRERDFKTERRIEFKRSL